MYNGIWRMLTILRANNQEEEQKAKNLGSWKIRKNNKRKLDYITKLFHKEWIKHTIQDINAE